MIDSKLINGLSAKTERARLAAVKALKKEEATNPSLIPKLSKESVNLQIHTNFSFSPYTPSLAAYMAYKFGLSAAGILDSYTLAGASEFSKACKILGVTYSVGTEVGGDFDFERNKASDIAILGIAERNIPALQKALEPYRKNQRENIASTIEAVNKKVKKFEIKIDYKKDVLPLVTKTKDMVYLSKYVYYALALKAVDKFGAGEKIVEFMKNGLSIDLTPTEEGLLGDGTNPYYIYDMAGIISENYKTFHIKKQYANPEEVVKLAHKYGAVCSFEYTVRKTDLSDEELILENAKMVDSLKALGFDAISYDPNKFSYEVRQAFLKKIEESEMLSLNYSRVEFPRRRFDCTYPDLNFKAVMAQSAYAIVGSEMCENQGKGGGGFVTGGEVELKSFEKKVEFYAILGRKCF